MAQLGLRQLPLHPCPWQDCTQTFSSEAAAFDHAAHDMHEHAEPGEMCNFRGCGKKLSRDPASVRRHVKKHVSDKQFNCPAPGCNARFKEKSKLARHSIVHTKERPYVCQECRKGSFLPLRTPA
jgi:KRAB domain-containing zinc finger protein